VAGVDGLIGTRRWMDIVPLVDRLSRSQAAGQLGRQPLIYRSAAAAPQAAALPRVAVQGASAYLKLADGCHRSCAFCAIPLIKGTTASRPREAIVADATWLAQRGVREIILIAQDTTSYGRDLGMGNGLADLLDALVEAVPGLPWIRVMYAFPGPNLVALAEAMARHDQVLPYLDIPLQHAHPDVLRRMRRPSDVDGMRLSIEHVRRRVPDVAIRTTFIVGFPGETGAEFRSLLRFVDEMAFDRVGAFVYSHEEGTPACEFEDDVAPELKDERRERLMALQQPISLSKNEALVGRTLDVLVEGQGDGISVGRSYRDAPEIDGLVLVQAELPVGEIVPAQVTAALEYDLLAVPSPD
jgi:ribosomal protein S12 methylthiotransferase